MHSDQRLLYETSTIGDRNLSLKWGEREEVLVHRDAFLSKFGSAKEECVSMEVEHADRITEVHAADRGKVIQTEAFITQEKGVILFLLTADCFPVAFYDPEKQVVALAHLGWKPTNMRLAAKVVEELKRVYGSQAHDIHVAVGPGIHKESYVFENPEQKELAGWADFLTELPDGRTQIDLVGHIQNQLTESGVPLENIAIRPVDTATSGDYFSHYRAVRTGEPEGRFATVLGLR